MKQYYVYICASRRKGTLYAGVTSNLIKRIYEHKNGIVAGFTKKYAVHILVWYEVHSSIDSAIAREKNIKNWHRKWKIELMETMNPEWDDLYSTLLL